MVNICKFKTTNQNFLIFGYFGWKNTGDDAMLYALLKQLYCLYPNAKFTVISQSTIFIPSEVKKNVKFVMPKATRIIKSIIKSTHIVLGGGTHFHDMGRNKRFFKALSKISILLLVAKVFRKRIYLLGIGIGPISTIWCKLLTRLICQLADFINVRDKKSNEIINKMGITSNAALSFDLSVILKPQFTNNDSELRKTNKNKILGVSITPVFEHYYNDKKRDILLINEIAKGLNEWLLENINWVIHLFVFKGKSKDDDVLLTELLLKKLSPIERVILIPYNNNPIEMLSNVSQCHAFIGMRLHSLIFAYICKIPLLVINYHPKCLSFAKDIGLPEYATVSLEEILNLQFNKYLEKLQMYPSCFLAKLPINIPREKVQLIFQNELNKYY